MITWQPPRVSHRPDQQGATSSGASLVPRRLLVVDDDYAVRQALVELLEDEGYDVRAAGNGQDALTRLQGPEPLPHLILLDLMMPIMDGWTFRALQQHDPRFHAIPVVVISAISDTHRQRAPIPAAAYIPKPINFALLLHHVTRVCADPSS